MKIGRLSFNRPYILAPLAGYTDLAFRLICRELGAAICLSEMISSHGLVYGQKKTLAMLKSIPEDRPIGFQIFGNDPSIMADGAALLTRYPIDFIDINMGCPVKKVVKKGSGVALMKDFDRAEKIIRAVKRNSILPVTVKFRSGWTNESIVAADFAAMSQDAGAAMVTIHARTWRQGFSGKADWKIIALVKDKVTIPVIGNGDILTYGDGERMIAETGCDGVMIGRGTLGNPWVFQQSGRPNSLTERLPVILRHIELINRFKESDKILFKIKKYTNRYLNGLSGASQIRTQVTDCSSVEKLIELLKFSAAQEI